MTSPTSAVCTEPSPSITSTPPSPGSDSTDFSSALSSKQRTVLIGPANSVRPPNWRNCRSQLRTSGPMSSTRSAVGRNVTAMSGRSVFPATTQSAHQQREQHGQGEGHRERQRGARGLRHRRARAGATPGWWPARPRTWRWRQPPGPPRPAAVSRCRRPARHAGRAVPARAAPRPAGSRAGPSWPAPSSAGAFLAASAALAGAFLAGAFFAGAFLAGVFFAAAFSGGCGVGGVASPSLGGSCASAIRLLLCSV